MINRLSNLAEFLEDDSLPLWLKQEIQKRREEIQSAFEQGNSITLTGPKGETVTIAPRTATVAAA